MQPDEPETIVGEGAGLGGEWWILGAQWEGPELHTIVHIFDTNERPRWWLDLLERTLETRARVSAAA